MRSLSKTEAVTHSITASKFRNSNLLV